MILRAFRALMPKEERFIERFTAHSDKIVEAAVAFRAMMSGDGRMEEHYATVRRVEDEADAITKDTIEAIHRTFITPFDRSDIRDLINGLDDTVDIMKDAGRRFLLRNVTEFTPEMQGMADCIVEAAQLIRQAMPMLGTINKSADDLHRICAEIKRIEGVADDIRDRGLAIVWDPASAASPGQRLIDEHLYELAESVVDRCEDVADVVGNIVIEQV